MRSLLLTLLAGCGSSNPYYSTTGDGPPVVAVDGDTSTTTDGNSSPPDLALPASADLLTPPVDDLLPSPAPSSDLAGSDLLPPPCECSPGAGQLSGDHCQVRTCKDGCHWSDWRYGTGNTCSTGAVVDCAPSMSCSKRTSTCLGCQWQACECVP